MAKPGNTTFSTLIELLQYRSAHQPNRMAYSYLSEDGEERTYTYEELDRRARALAASLLERGAKGERALLLYQPGLEYISAFFGCLYAGVVPVPAYPPRSNGNLGRLQSIVVDSDAKYALTVTSIMGSVERGFADSPRLMALEWLVSDTITEERADQWQDPGVSTDALAFLQYTSGSTSLPKGVMLSHGNLLSNLQLIEDCFGTEPESQCVIWLPPYHDMGLIGGILQPMYTGYPVTLMAPVDFIQRPLKWLQTISRVGGTVSGGPNFAYDLCVQKITPEQRDQLDLSNWKVAFSGAEPIRKESLDRFAEYFAPAGFRKEAFYPCYGLAEGTLFVSGGLQEEAPISHSFHGDSLSQNRAVEVDVPTEEDRTLVSSGRISHVQQKVRIADPQTKTVCPEGTVGEIWVCGPSVAKGYWNREEQTKETFHAYLEDTNEGPFLRTGDLGFVVDDELYVTGRLKDLVIIRGRNYYPQDIEFSVQESHVAVRNSNGAAFSIDVDGEERLVVVQEMERAHRKTDPIEVVTAIRQRVSEEHQLQVYAVVLLKPVSIPKTSSGKVQRHQCRERFLNSTLDVIFSDLMAGHVEAAGAMEVLEDDAAAIQLDRAALLALEGVERQAALAQYLQAQAARVLRMSASQINVEQSLNVLGLDSLMAVELKNELEENFGVFLSLTRFLEGPSIVELSGDVCAKLLEEGEAVEASVPTVEVSANALSQGQRALWFLQRLAPQSAAYNISRAAKVLSELDADALKAAFVELVQRHPQLRTNFVIEKGNPAQSVSEAANLSFAYEDASAWSEQALEERLTEEANRPFDLEKDALLRVNLFKRGAQEHVLQLNVHHIVTDFWSFGVMVEELQALYSAQKGGPAVPAPTATNYGEHVVRQAQLLAGPQGEKLKAYWQDKLSGELPLLNLPTDRPRPAVQTYRGEAVGFRVPEVLGAKLKGIAQEQGATLYMVLLAAFQVLLHRYTGQQDILVGSPTTGRSSSKDAGVVGYFVNPVVQRADFASVNTFSEFLQQVRQTVLGALEHQEYPFPLLVDLVQAKRDASYPPLFQVMFSYQKSHVQGKDSLSAFAIGEAGTKLQAGDLLFESLELPTTQAQFDMTLMMAESDGGFVGKVEYNRDLFDPATMERFTEHFQTLLGGIAADSAQSVATLPLLTEGERQQVLGEWNETETLFAADRCIHGLFEEQAAKTPDATALVFEDRELTFRELNEQANRLGRHLQDLGVGPESLVGICLERSPEMIVGLLGILKAGGAYVPLDPTYPAERIGYMLEDAKAQVIVTKRRVAATLPETGAKQVVLDAEWETIAALSAENVESAVKSDNLAYMIYTSGSTGKPKGVMIQHRSAVNFFKGMDQRVGREANDAILAVTSICFDISVLELFWTLTSGIKVVLLSEQEAAGGLGRVELTEADGETEAQERGDFSLKAQAQKHGATLLQCTPSLMKILSAETETLESLQGLRAVMLGGEALPASQARQLKEALPARLLNMYGPTEATVWTTTYEVPDAQTSIVPLGKPFANMETYVLDANLQPVPVGVPGELFIGGQGVARGYFERAELTAERFIASPFKADATLYRTGDAVRWLADGNIEFLGRIDQQVKIRGFRIELGEIESVLTQHAAVKEAVVVAKGTDEQKFLVAYVVAEGDTSNLTADLKLHLQGLLPEYMVPSTFMYLDALPLTLNGKIDRKALPEPQMKRASLDETFVASETDLEKNISEIWQDVLRVERVGIYDNFFELGGHSLQIVQVQGQLREKLGIDMPLVELFQFPTISALAKHLSQADQKVSNVQQGKSRADARRESQNRRRTRNR